MEFTKNELKFANDLKATLFSKEKKGFALKSFDCIQVMFSKDFSYYIKKISNTHYWLCDVANADDVINTSMFQPELFTDLGEALKELFINEFTHRLTCAYLGFKEATSAMPNMIQAIADIEQIMPVI